MDEIDEALRILKEVRAAIIGCCDPAGSDEDGYRIRHGELIAWFDRLENAGLHILRSHLPVAIITDSCTGLCKDGSGEGCNCGPAVTPAEPQRPVWQPIETAPKDRTILLYGPQVGGSKGDLAGWDGNIVASGYYDGIDTSWCVTGSTWRGPFIGATHWRELPAAPASTVSRPQQAGES